MIERAFNGGKQSYKDKIAWRENIWVLSSQNVKVDTFWLWHKSGLACLTVPHIIQRWSIGSMLRHRIQGDRSLWGLYNAMTFGAHKVRPSDKMDVHKQLVSFTEKYPY